ncbi:hypothetical protein GCM10023333_13530 [Ferrimonas pelagia]|uniref:Uncharacterized protein n=1 Tax=Ferrimonas pelagia TaxID=1177826 RepID=A0ABP9EPG6_9GAMM
MPHAGAETASVSCLSSTAIEITLRPCAAVQQFIGAIPLSSALLLRLPENTTSQGLFAFLHLKHPLLHTVFTEPFFDEYQLNN